MERRRQKDQIFVGNSLERPSFLIKPLKHASAAALAKHSKRVDVTQFRCKSKQKKKKMMKRAPQKKEMEMDMDDREGRVWGYTFQRASEKKALSPSAMLGNSDR